MTHHTRVFCVVLILIAGLAGSSAIGEEGRIPIFEPIVITTSGSYVVTRDITAVGTAPVIDIQGPPGGSASIVRIDLNGFTVSTLDAGNNHVITATGLESLTIRNGAIKRPDAAGFIYGLNVVTTNELTVEDVNFGTAWILGEDLGSFSIRHNTFPASNGGIHLEETGAATVEKTGIIENNVIRGAGSIKVASQASNRGRGVLIRNNRIEGGNFWAILAQAQDVCVITGNRIDGNSGEGISLDSSNNCTVTDNVIFNVGLDGMFFQNSDNNLITNNLVVGSGTGNNSARGSGIRVEGSRNHLDGNVTNGNHSAGIFFESGTNNTYGRNMSHDNGVNPGVACANPGITSCPTPYGTGSSAPDLCDNGASTLTLCDNLMPGPPRS